ncbi:45876_t:CDS:10 [Gigaspora margarita]|uniref:GPI ethanolamine phosphate transferase 2 n=1 Tax=Gigaspora margarita TaxID=4874 RepID=A0ABM8VXN7_GIGMA|nr:45876_t:CDS:10 [Gigaspora margarita]
MQTCKRSCSILIVLLAAQFIGLGLFSKGFFPYKASLPGFSTIEEHPKLPNGDKAAPLVPKFDRLVFMLVDALRSDFVFGENSDMNFVKKYVNVIWVRIFLNSHIYFISLIENHHAVPYTAIATAPTVTLPRIKALTTGSVPNFLDVILNIAESDTSSSLLSQDNWLVQIKKAGNKSISFFGDDTWIKLFPGVFNTTDGTTSFFATDTVEVDLNVTRNVKPQLSKPDWDVLIFHYLGLDHVGHSGGPHSPLMRPKQKEMDDVVKIIYDTIIDQDTQRIQANKNAKPTLFILCGDHGMNESNLHPDSVPICPKPALDYPRLLQIYKHIFKPIPGVAPEYIILLTILSLLQRHIDLNQISFFSPMGAFVFMSSKFNTVKHVHDKMSTNHDPPSFRYYKVVNQVDVVPTLSYLFGVPIPKNNLGKVMLDLLVDTNEFEKLRVMQLNAHQLSGILQNTWISFDCNPNITLQSGKNCDQDADDVKTRLQCLYWLSYYYHAMALNSIDANYISNASFFYDKFISESSSYISSSFSDYDVGSMYWGLLFMGFASVCFVIVLVNQNARRRKQIRNREKYNKLQFLSYLGTFGLCITMFSSSFIEEEHQFWYFWIQTMWFGFIIYRSSKFVHDQILALLSACQMVLIRIIRIWNQTGQKYAGEIDLRFYFNTSHVYYMWILFFCSMLILTTMTLREILVTRLIQGKNILQIVLQLISVLIIIFIAFSITKYKLEIDGGSILFPDIFSWIIMIVPITLPVMLARMIYATIGASLVLISLLTILQSKLRNTQDISNSYVGVTKYNPSWVGMLTFLANWAGPIWWVFAGNLLRFEIVERRVFINHSEKNKSPTSSDVDEGSAINNSNSETSQINNTTSNTLSHTSSAISAATIATKQELKRLQYHTSLFQIMTFHSLLLFIISIAVTILRSHLFIWTVFSPKYLYQIVWYILFLVGVEKNIAGEPNFVAVDEDYEIFIPS